MLVNIEQIIDSTHNARHIAADPDKDRQLAASIRAVGLLQPLVVMPGPMECYTLIAGRRRLAAVRTLGWTQVEVTVPVESEVDESYIVAASTAENMVRSGMHPVDQWRAVSGLVSRGMTIEQAGLSLGISANMVARMRHLSLMHPSVIEALALEPVLPEVRVLRTIAAAPHEVQIAGLAGAGTNDPEEGGRVNWWRMSTLCECTRIPRERAIFALDPSPVVFEEDLFAEPGSAAQFTTADTAGFLNAQKAALHVQVATRKDRYSLVEWNSNRHEPALPAGWVASWKPVPQRFRKDDPARVFAAVVETGHNLGQVIYRMAIPDEVRAGAEPAKATAVRAPITKAVQGKLAVVKGEALHAALDVYKDNGPTDMLRALLLTMAAKNLTTYDPKVIGAALVDAEGQPRDVTEEDLCALAAQVIDDVVAFDSPDNWKSSGPAAESLAVTVGAVMPRCDHPDILKGVSSEVLADAATEHGIPTQGTVSDLRKRLVGAMPHWSPVDFGAPGPVEVEDEEAGEADPDEDEDPDVRSLERTIGLSREDAGGVVRAVNDDDDDGDATDRDAQPIPANLAGLASSPDRRP